MRNFFHTFTAVMSLICWSNFIKITSQARFKCMHVHCPPILMKFSMFFCIRRVIYEKKWLQITTPYTLCLTCVIALQIHHSIEPTSMPVLLYTFHIKIIFQNLKQQLLRYYICMGHTKKSNCALTLLLFQCSEWVRRGAQCLFHLNLTQVSLPSNVNRWWKLGQWKWKVLHCINRVAHKCCHLASMSCVLGCWPFR